MAVRDVANALYGLSRLLRFDGRAWEYFDRSPQGFLASYVVALIVAPFHFAHAALAYDATQTTLGPLLYAIVQGLSYVITWTLFPFAMMYISRILGRESRYFWHMVPYNWIQLPVAIPLFTLTLLTDLQILPVAAYQFIQLVAMFVVAIYTTFIAAIGLRVPVGTAMSLMVLDYALTFLASALIARI